MGRSAPRHDPMPSMAPSHVAFGAQDNYGQGRGGRPWRRLREQILKRDGYLCQCEECRASDALPAVADEVDHIDNTRGRDGRLNDHPSNLRAINSVHHKRKTAREARRGRR